MFKSTIFSIKKKIYIVKVLIILHNITCDIVAFNIVLGNAWIRNSLSSKPSMKMCCYCCFCWLLNKVEIIQVGMLIQIYLLLPNKDSDVGTKSQIINHNPDKNGIIELTMIEKLSHALPYRLSSLLNASKSFRELPRQARDWPFWRHFLRHKHELYFIIHISYINIKSMHIIELFLTLGL